jgi:hypothetical protein
MATTAARDLCISTRPVPRRRLSDLPRSGVAAARADARCPLPRDYRRRGRSDPTTVPGINVPRARRPGCVALLASHPVWAIAFPQGLGRGRKHRRRIGLEDWQREVAHDHPTSLLRGLLHSDGCRSITGSRPRFRAGGSVSTATSATSSPTIRRTSGGSSASTATWSDCVGHSRASRTSRSRIVTRSRCSTGSSGRSGESADERTRTSTGPRAHQDLNLERLPVPPRPRVCRPVAKITAAGGGRRI